MKRTTFRPHVPKTVLLAFLTTFPYVAQAQDATVPVHTPPAPSHGWTKKAAANLVTASSGKRNNVFYVGDPVVFQLKGTAAASYEVRDYWGNILESGPVTGTSLPLKETQPGWYKLYLYQRHDPALDAPPVPMPPVNQDPEADQTAIAAARLAWQKDVALRLFGDSVGGTMFAIFRNDPHFPPIPAIGAPGDGDGFGDQTMRDVIGMGPERLSADAAKPDQSIAELDQQVAIDKALYLPFDPERHRELMIAFGNGTKGMEDGVRQIVEHFKDTVHYYEPRNEPNGGSSGHDFVINEMEPFYATVKGVDPNLKVMGPGTVSIDPKLQPWIEDFLKAGGGKYIDAFSFHAYNCVNGDLWLARAALTTTNALLAKYGVDTKEKWQTEQGFMAAVYGSYQPRLQGRWTMLEMMAFEQFGIPKEHNHLWYDKSHGFWDVPTWWENNDGSLDPAGPLMRVWSEELYGTKYAKAYDFGDPGNKLYLASLFTGSGKSIAAFQSAGGTDGRVQLKVTGGAALHVVSAFGVESTLPVQDGFATLPVPELPVYVELAPGQSLDLVPTQWGPDLALAPGVTATCSADPATKEGQAAIADLPKLTNGQLENWYWAQTPDSAPFTWENCQFPATLEVDLPAPQPVAHVVIYATTPWQKQGTLTGYELQVDHGGQWVTLDRVTEPTKTFGVFTPATRTTCDSFFSDRSIFTHNFAPVTTAKIRLLIHGSSYGGGATQLVSESGGQAWGNPTFAIREIEIYGK